MVELGVLELDAVRAKAVLASKGRGQVEAERDINAGKLMLRFRHSRRGAPLWFPKYQRLLKDSCGVETVERPEAGPATGRPGLQRGHDHGCPSPFA